MDTKIVASLKAKDPQGNFRHIANYINLETALRALKRFEEKPLSERIDDDVYYLVY